MRSRLELSYSLGGTSASSIDVSAEEGVLGSSCRLNCVLDPLLNMPENCFFMATKSKVTRLLERGLSKYPRLTLHRTKANLYMPSV